MLNEELKRKKESLDITAICKTEEEYLTMLILIVYCQHFYRKLKKAGESITIFDIVALARNAYNQGQSEIPKDEKSEIIWG